MKRRRDWALNSRIETMLPLGRWFALTAAAISLAVSFGPATPSGPRIQLEPSDVESSHDAPDGKPDTDPIAGAGGAPHTRYLPVTLSNQHSGRAGIARTEPSPKNVILFIGDGMGAAHVAAARAYRHGERGRLVFETFPHRATMATTNVYGAVSDSAAAGTAMATCTKVANGVISKPSPTSGKSLPTALEAFRGLGKLTGLVTTSTLTDATPAAFGAHQADRSYDEAIAGDYLFRSRPHVLFGGGSPGLSPERASGAGYRVIRDRVGLAALDPAGVDPVAGLFGNEPLPSAADGLGAIPSLAEMTRSALSILDRGPNGFFLLVEEEGTDTYAHGNDLKRTVRATLELADAVQVARGWAETHRDTLIVVTADHETGGLAAVQNKGAGKLPRVRWTTADHTDQPVPIYAVGPGAAQVVGSLDNTDLSAILLPPSALPHCR
jgi:alkaline phosphatase